MCVCEFRVQRLPNVFYDFEIVGLKETEPYYERAGNWTRDGESRLTHFDLRENSWFAFSIIASTDPEICWRSSKETKPQNRTYPNTIIQWTARSHYVSPVFLCCKMFRYFRESLGSCEITWEKEVGICSEHVRCFVGDRSLPFVFGNVAVALYKKAT